MRQKAEWSRTIVWPLYHRNASAREEIKSWINRAMYTIGARLEIGRSKDGRRDGVFGFIRIKRGSRFFLNSSDLRGHSGCSKPFSNVFHEPSSSNRSQIGFKLQGSTQWQVFSGVKCLKHKLKGAAPVLHGFLLNWTVLDLLQCCSEGCWWLYCGWWKHNRKRSLSLS